ncbi:MAG TPA: L-histidine N(alpha)-methyltransferase [Casimicrobiaceae bacterium]|nr:L-histidine N(alpha)-methyltransferase [Casimicrobiaceae bacterium]
MSPLIRDRFAVDAEDERRVLVAGLRATPASIAPKYFYDARGCDLFAAICELPEYYPTRTEASIFATQRAALRAIVGTRKECIDLGAGDCSKAPLWFDLFTPSRYVAVDIARDALARALPPLAARHPGVEMLGVVADFTHGLDLARDLRGGPVTFVYPGSSIGNFAPHDAVQLLRAIRRHCGDDASGLLIGVDTKKDVARLSAAYDDAQGVTAEFNRNVLLHVNRILGTRFDPAAFAHVAFYASEASRIEMHLEARSEQSIVIDGIERIYGRGERILTEHSYKYAPDEFEALLSMAGFRRVTRFQDAAGDFAVYYAA